MARTSMGNVVEDLTTLSRKKQEEYATTFCEGDENLKKLLLKMWENKIQTYACCAGHDPATIENGKFLTPNNPYIYFEVSSLSEKQQQKLYKNLIMIAKNLGSIEKFELILDNYMDFEKHGLTIRMRNSEYSYRVLNDLFDDVFKKESVLDSVKKFFIKRNANDKLSEDELQFVESLIEMNNINFTEYLESAKDFKAEDKIKELTLEFDRNRGKFFRVGDGVHTSISVVNNEMGSYWFQVAEGMYTSDHNTGDFYTLENGELKKLKESELADLKEFTDSRKFNFSTIYNKGLIKKVNNEIDRVKLLNNLNDI